jgi:hypothetical protein
MHLQRRRLVKHLLNKTSEYVSLFGALICFMYRNSSVIISGL